LSVNKIVKLVIGRPTIDEQDEIGEKFFGIENRIKTKTEALKKH
jgi:hypothetical protein